MPAYELMLAPGAVDDLMLGQVVADGIDGNCEVLDAGSGRGVSSLALAAQARSVTVRSVEIDRNLHDAHREAVTRFGMSDRIFVEHGDVFEHHNRACSVVMSNPPLLPGELGFSRLRADGANELFWVQLMRTLSTWSQPPPAYLHLFQFHGVESRTGEHPSLREAARSFGFRLERLFSGSRYVRKTSRIVSAAAALANVFPDGEIVVDGVKRAFRVIDSERLRAAGTLYVRQVIAVLSPK